MTSWQHPWHMLLWCMHIHDIAKNCTHKKWLNLIFYTSIYINTCYMRVKSRCMCLVRVKLTAYKSSPSLLYYIKIAFFWYKLSEFHTYNLFTKTTYYTFHFNFHNKFVCVTNLGDSLLLWHQYLRCLQLIYWFIWVGFC